MDFGAYHTATADVVAYAFNGNELLDLPHSVNVLVRYNWLS